MENIPPLQTDNIGNGACRRSSEKPSFFSAIGNFFSFIFKGLSCLGCGCMTVIVLFAGITFFGLVSDTSDGEKICRNLTNSFSGEDSISLSSKYVCGKAESKNKIAVIDVDGVIVGKCEPWSSEMVSSEEICAVIRKLKEDDDVKAIIVNVNTPGGEVTASDCIYNELKNCGKKVVAMLNSQATSGGYYVACAAEKIVANRTTLTGSIGVIITSFNYSRLADRFGVKEEIYASGPMKTLLNGGKATTPAEAKVVKELVMNSYYVFASVVAASRNFSVGTVTDTEIGDGRVFDGKQAFEKGLVDRLGYFDDAVDEAKKLAELDDDFVVVRYSKTVSIADVLFSSASSFGSAKIEFSPLPASFKLKKGCLYYLPSTL